MRRTTGGAPATARRASALAVAMLSPPTSTFRPFSPRPIRRLEPELEQSAPQRRNTAALTAPNNLPSTGCGVAQFVW
jgi:hypothetical protein